MSRASYPQIFKDFPQLATVGQEDENGEVNVLAIKDIDSYDLKGTYFSGKSLVVELLRCQPNSSPLPCAEESEINEYLSKHILTFGRIQSFIDYDNVEPRISPVKQFFSNVK